MPHNTGLNASFPSASREQAFVEQLKKLEDLSSGLTHPNVKPLTNLDLSMPANAVKRMDTPVALDFGEPNRWPRDNTVAALARRQRVEAARRYVLVVGGHRQGALFELGDRARIALGGRDLRINLRLDERA